MSREFDKFSKEERREKHVKKGNFDTKNTQYQIKSREELSEREREIIRDTIKKQVSQSPQATDGEITYHIALKLGRLLRKEDGAMCCIKCVQQEDGTGKIWQIDIE